MKRFLLILVVLILTGCASAESAFDKKVKCHSYHKEWLETAFFQSADQYRTIESVFYSPSEDTCVVHSYQRGENNFKEHTFIDILAGVTISNFDSIDENYKVKVSAEISRLKGK